MRTATTWGKTHKGDWEPLASPGVPLMEQKQTIREMLGKPHDKFAEVHYQESDGSTVVYRFKTSEAHEANQQLRAKEHEAFLAAQAPKPSEQKSGEKSKKK